MKALEQLLLEAIQLEGGWKSKLAQLKAQFDVEARMGRDELQEVTQWLQGLPSNLGIPYMHDDIEDFYSWYLDREIKGTERQKLLDGWFPDLAKTLIRMWGVV
jgi:hypothetical protein